jgi:pyruvate dehydrogenase E1 component alpha subunit
MLYESLNMAQLWKLPVIYVCENNLYNEYTHHSESTAGSMKARAEAFGLMSLEVDGQNVRDVHEAARRLVERARRGDGPAFMLCHTYRYLGHHVGDVNREYYRSKAEEQEWRAQRDPLTKLSTWLIDNDLADPDMFGTIERDVRAEVEAAVQYALAAPFPGPEEVDKHVFS